MIKAFIFIIAIVTNDGSLEMRGLEVEACPKSEAFSAGMDAMIKDGKIKDWNALCYKLPVKGQDI